jgi:ATP-dependent Clp protease ATP-binding subunit ClpC
LDRIAGELKEAFFEKKKQEYYRPGGIEIKMFDRFTDHVRKVMEFATQEAFRLNKKYVDTEHILLGLIKEDSGVGITVLKNLIDIKNLRIKIEKPITADSVTVTNLRMPVTPAVKKVIEYAIEEARLLNDYNVGTQHLLRGLLRHADGTAAAALADLGLKYEQVRSEVLKFSGNTPEAGS